MVEKLRVIAEFLSIFSIIILAFGIFIIFTQKNNNNKTWLLIYLTCLFMLENSVLLLGIYLRDNMFFIFILSFFIHFLFLTYFYGSTIFKFSLTRYYTIMSLGVFPFFIYIIPEPYYSFLQYYGRLPYSFTIMLYCLMYLYMLISGKISNVHSKNVLNGTALAFFTLDTFLATGTEYLIKESILLVAWFWFIRALFLQIYYISLIYYGWKSSKSS